jgi:hypothetical protein
MVRRIVCVFTVVVFAALTGAAGATASPSHVVARGDIYCC